MIFSAVPTPRVEGVIAFFEGKGPEVNPYSPLKPEFHDWLNGYECEIEFISDAFDSYYGLPKGSA
jgi:hypothetical protein